MIMLPSAKLFIWLWAGCQSCLAMTTVDWASSCTSLNERKSWNVLTNKEKANYIQAERCFQRQPAELGLPGHLTLWDDLQWTHIIQSNWIHGSGQFLPWHRYYVRLHEHLLQTRCNYTGAQPYWDELTDVAAAPIEDAAIWDSRTGFGGNGAGDDLCVSDGPFASLALRVNATGDVMEDYCLSRNFSQAGFDQANSTYLDPCMALETYVDTWPCLNAKGPHAAGHQATGGVMFQLTAAPGDPIFFLHHAYLDRVWWQWQQKDLEVRLLDMGGNNFPDATTLRLAGLGDPSPALLDYDGDISNVTTMNHTLWVGGIVQNMTVGDVMDIRGDVICAEYIG